MKKIKNTKGFTLMEMLIVVAIIAILVAIAIPTFTKQLEKAREATDMANLRSAYAEVMAAALTGDASGKVTNNNGVWTTTVTATQKVANWQSDAPNIGGQTDVKALTTGNWTVTYTESTGVVEITPKTTE